MEQLWTVLDEVLYYLEYGTAVNCIGWGVVLLRVWNSCELYWIRCYTKNTIIIIIAIPDDRCKCGTTGDVPSIMAQSSHCLCPAQRQWLRIHPAPLHCLPSRVSSHVGEYTTHNTQTHRYNMTKHDTLTQYDTLFWSHRPTRYLESMI